MPEKPTPKPPTPDEPAKADLSTPEGLRTYRTALVAELTQVSQLAQAHAAKAQELERRAIFLNGSIAMLNDQLGDTPAPPLAAVPANRATRRRAAKARAA